MPIAWGWNVDVEQGQRGFAIGDKKEKKCLED